MVLLFRWRHHFSCLPLICYKITVAFRPAVLQETVCRLKNNKVMPPKRKAASAMAETKPANEINTDEITSVKAKRGRAKKEETPTVSAHKDDDDQAPKLEKSRRKGKAKEESTQEEKEVNGKTDEQQKAEPEGEVENGKDVQDELEDDKETDAEKNGNVNEEVKEKAQGKGKKVKGKAAKTKDSKVKKAKSEEPEESEEQKDESTENGGSGRPDRAAKRAAAARQAERDNEEIEGPKKKSRAATKQKRAAAKEKEDSPEEREEKEAPKKTGRGGRAEKVAATSSNEEETAPSNQTETDWTGIDFECVKTNPKDEKYNLKIISWNVDGMRAWLKKDGLKILEHAKPDILCLQEIKCSEDKVPEEMKSELEGYKQYWCASDKEGYAGVALFSKAEPLDVKYGIGDESQDEEGRCITAEYENFYLVSVYVPNAGRKLVTMPKRLEWNQKFKEFVKELDKKKPVILCGDMNVAHSEIDLANPKTNTKNAGFTQEERDGMSEFLDEGFVDTYRKLYPDEEKVYTFWTYMMKSRSKNVGWRLDYFIVSDRIMENVCDNVVHSQVYGSDHCPITLFLNI